jgi:predicted esterase
MTRQLIGAAIAVLALAKAPDVDGVFAAFWSAQNRREAARAAEQVVNARVPFDDAYRRLKQGRAYSTQPTGIVRLTNRTDDGVEHHYALNIPATYDPATKYQVRVHLHGGVMMRQTNVPPANAGTVGALTGADQIYIVPFSWQDAPWWSDDQIQNLDDILDAAKRRYNIDENRIVLSGVSDGATGAYYVAMRDTTPFASFLPLNGFIMVLANGDLRVDGGLYPNNLRNKPWFVVNGGRDPLYPTSRVDPYITHLKKGGVSIDYRPQPDAGHNTAWWPQMKDAFESFVRDHPRNPLPDALTWETSTAATHNRAHWLVIDALWNAKGESTALDDVNVMVGPPAPDFGARTIGTRINRVIAGSNADKIGLKAGDVLVRLNGESVHVRVDVAEALEDVTPGSELTLLVARDNKPVELTGVYQPDIVTPPPGFLFDRTLPSGRVDVTREGNTITAISRGVMAFTLLLSPDQFDFSKPVKVIANGKTVFEKKVEKDVRALMKWAAIDNDRTMLLGAEVHIRLN